MLTPGIFMLTPGIFMLTPGIFAVFKLLSFESLCTNYTVIQLFLYLSPKLCGLVWPIFPMLSTISANMLPANQQTVSNKFIGNILQNCCMRPGAVRIKQKSKNQLPRVYCLISIRANAVNEYKYWTRNATGLGNCKDKRVFACVHFLRLYKLLNLSWSDTLIPNLKL